MLRHYLYYNNARVSKFGGPVSSPPSFAPKVNRVSSVGDQHRGNPASIMMPNSTGAITTNPFEEPQRRINEYTAQEIATLQARLDKKLGPEYISSRPGAAGQRVHYLSADKCINLANEVFGFNGWSSSIQNIQIDFVEESPNTGKISLGLSVIVRVTLKDGTYHEVGITVLKRACLDLDAKSRVVLGYRLRSHRKL